MIEKILRKKRLIAPDEEEIRMHQRGLEPIGLLDAQGRQILKDYDGAYVALEEVQPASEAGLLDALDIGVFEKDLIWEPRQEEQEKRLHIPQAVKYVAAGLALAGIIGVIGGPAQAVAAEKKPELAFGYNALEIALSQQGDVRARLLSNIDFSVAGIELGIAGLNQLDSLKPDSYFGRNAILLGPKGAAAKAVAVIKMDSQGIFDAKYGIRSIGIPEMLGGYGFLDIAADKDAVNAAMFYGRPLGKGFGVEALQDFEIPFKGQVFPYSEIQINKDLGDKAMIFVRAEIPDFKPAQGVYMAGIALKLQ